MHWVLPIFVCLKVNCLKRTLVFNDVVFNEDIHYTQINVRMNARLVLTCFVPIVRDLPIRV